MVVERRLERRSHGFGDGSRRLREGVEQDADRRDRLADVVVQLTRHPLALGLEVLEHVAREAPLDRLDLLPFGDVADDAEEVGGAAVVDTGEAHLGRDVDPVAAERPRFEGGMMPWAASSSIANTCGRGYSGSRSKSVMPRSSSRA